MSVLELLLLRPVLEVLLEGVLSDARLSNWRNWGLVNS